MAPTSPESSRFPQLSRRTDASLSTWRARHFVTPPSGSWRAIILRKRRYIGETCKLREDPRRSRHGEGARDRPGRHVLSGPYRAGEERGGRERRRPRTAPRLGLQLHLHGRRQAWP
ncbi:MAG: hypothetical protein DI526_18575 [Caulobacter segnis]|uniref:Uncharacterized protein n=1 Tax=Caulobacter segnis TaxID=88688 RepID=A0A2W5WDX4_9CAUL|nr:MAG: hypothetical protein DI526_18575 [Caulobacter segnis]